MSHGRFEYLSILLAGKNPLIMSHLNFDSQITKKSDRALYRIPVQVPGSIPNLKDELQGIREKSNVMPDTVASVAWQQRNQNLPKPCRVLFVSISTERTIFTDSNRMSCPMNCVRVHKFKQGGQTKAYAKSESQ
jgi:hypothetical protein